MEFAASEEVEALRRTLTRFVTEEVFPLQHEHRLTWDTAPPKELRKQVRLRSKALGLYGLDMPTEVGGAGMAFSDCCLLEMDAHFHDTVFFQDLLGGALVQRPSSSHYKGLPFRSVDGLALDELRGVARGDA